MKLFIIRYTKIAFTILHLHVVFNFFSGIFLNLYYLTKFSLWVSKNRKIEYNDFPGKWNYEKRYDLYKWVMEKENLFATSINYLEFGVAQGSSIRWFVGQNNIRASRFYGFDTFTGLPEDFGAYKKGTFNSNNQVPDIADARVKFFQGLFQQTLPGFLSTLDNASRNVIMMDADLYSSTMYVLTTIAGHLKKDDIIFFDEFAVPTHEFKAFYDFTQSYYVNMQLIAAANNYYFAAFKIV
jgi:O-methyltransferase